MFYTDACSFFYTNDKSVGLCTQAACTTHPPARVASRRVESHEADTPPRDDDDASVFASDALARVVVRDGVVFTKDGNDDDADEVAAVSSGDADDGF